MTMPAMKPTKSMRSFRRQSMNEDFVMEPEQPMPELPKGGAIVKVYFAGACYTNAQVVNSGQKRPRMLGVMDTSLFPGFEVSGIVEELCPTMADAKVKLGDRVIVYPTDQEEFTDSGYNEYIAIKDANNLIPLPDNLALDVAAILPCGALAAYSAVVRVKPLVEQRLLTSTGTINVLIVGAGGLGLWTLRVAEHFVGAYGSRVRVFVADTNVEKLAIAKAHGCTDVIHWDDSQHEEYILMRTKNACKGGIDVAIDFVSSTRTINRTTKALKEGGILIVGGNSKCDVTISLFTLALRSQSIVGVRRGSRQQLSELVQLVAAGQIKPPIFNVFPVDDANRVFRQLSQSRLNGRAVLRVCSADHDSVFFSPSQEELAMLRGNFSLPAALLGEMTPELPLSPEPPSSPSSETDGRAPGGAFFLPSVYQE